MSILSIVKAFFHRNSVSRFSVPQAWRGFAFLTRMAVLLRSLTALCKDRV